jgi:hypothetical protein
LQDSGFSARPASSLSSQPGCPGVKIMCENTRREPASSLIFLRASAICSLVRNQSCSISDGAEEISEILVSLSRNISFL